MRRIRDEEVERFSAQGITPPDDLPVAVGCEACQQSGYKERIGVFEVAAVTPEFATAIENGKSETELRGLLRANNVPSLVSDGFQKVREGVTSLEEVTSMSRLWTLCHHK